MSAECLLIASGTPGFPGWGNSTGPFSSTGAGSGGSYWYARQTARGWGCGGSGAHANSTNDGTPGMQGVVVIEEYGI